MSEEKELYGLSECLPMTPEMRKEKLPFFVALLAIGCHVVIDYALRKDVVRLSVGSVEYFIHRKDYDLACDLKSFLQLARCDADIRPSPFEVLQIEAAARDVLKSREDSRKGKKLVAMIRNDGSSGYWRMIVPARFMNKDRFSPDVTLSRNIASSLLYEYDTIFVQMIYDWESFYLLEKLKRMGKKLVFDFDDDIFNLPANHYLRQTIGLDQCFAALACMGLADIVTCTTNDLAKVLGGNGVREEKIRVIPNAMDLEGFPDFSPHNEGRKRIFWSGSHTHVDDWKECVEALDAIFKRRNDVVLTIWGFMPPAVALLVNTSEYWRGRVEFVNFRYPDSYFAALRELRADVGILPLAETDFNKGRSAIKFLEFSMAGMPVVASNVRPYSLVIEDEETGLLVEGARDWQESIERLLDNRDLARAMTLGAREYCAANGDIRKVVSKWEDALG